MPLLHLLLAWDQGEDGEGTPNLTTGFEPLAGVTLYVTDKTALSFFFLAQRSHSIADAYRQKTVYTKVEDSVRHGQNSVKLFYLAQRSLPFHRGFISPKNGIHES